MGGPAYKRAGALPLFSVGVRTNLLGFSVENETRRPMFVPVQILPSCTYTHPNIPPQSTLWFKFRAKKKEIKNALGVAPVPSLSVQALRTF
jgi:hypothetical protein